MTIFSCLGFAFFGMFWTHVVGDAMRLLSERWREEIKKEREQEKAKENEETLEAWIKNFSEKHPDQ